ncbi:hypothetical protein [Sphingobacterium faecale]|uniref:Uncharacterized protein n=1 Tax=Sphingobacterium faecale TaxID=2803775 RepID=A0ABS1QYS5_9SPHI|nr:hypothetical protein [Sphingobacterium faecale]MBL1407340.1 hypothetical protein [Sphingobacterium faecale]
MNKTHDMKILLSGIIYFIIAFSSLYAINPEAEVFAIFSTSFTATVITLFLFWIVVLLSKKRKQIGKIYPNKPID